MQTCTRLVSAASMAQAGELSPGIQFIHLDLTVKKTRVSPVSPQLPCNLLRHLVSTLHPGGVADQFGESHPLSLPDHHIPHLACGPDEARLLPVM